jgi:hypothetical protein
MLETLDDPIEIMIFGFELPYRGGRMSGNQDFFSGFAEHCDLHVPIGFLRHILFELIEQFDVFVGQFENCAPDLLARRRHHAGEAAPPLRRPAAELNGMVREGGQHLELVFRSSALQLGGVEIIGVQEKFHEVVLPLLLRGILLTHRLLPAQARLTSRSPGF